MPVGTSYIIVKELFAISPAMLQNNFEKNKRFWKKDQIFFVPK